MISRGSIWWADLGSRAGSAPAFRRPVLIVQANPYNRSALATCIIVAITSNTAVAGHPGNVFLPAAATGLDRDSVANVSQVSTVDRAALAGEIGALPDYLMEEVERGLRRVLAL